MSYTAHSSHALFNSNFTHLHAAEDLEHTGHLWYADGATAGAIAPFGQSFDLNEVVFSRGYMQLHTGLIGLHYSGNSMPSLMINNLEEGVDPW